MKYNFYNLGEWIGVILDEAQGKNGEQKKKRKYRSLLAFFFFHLRWFI